jgi:hypothetical protein
MLQIVYENSKLMSFENGKIDSVICINTDYFWEDLHDYFREIWGVLKVCGKLY